MEESKCMMDGDTSCMEEDTLMQSSKDHMSNIKQTDEISPLMNETSFNFKNIAQPVVSHWKLVPLSFRSFCSRVPIRMILVQMSIYLTVDRYQKRLFLTYENNKLL